MTDEIDTTGAHFVRTKRGPLKSRWQVYAWRGGPCIHTVDQFAKPAWTVDMKRKLQDARAAPKPKGETFADLVDAYLASPEYLALADYTKRDYKRWLERAKDEFGPDDVKAFDEPSMRRDVIEWRDNWKHSARMADAALQTLSIVLSWGVERSWLAADPVKLIGRKYQGSTRADILWTDAEIDAVAGKMRPHLARAFRLAAWTGLARGDLVALRWDQVGDLYISRPRNKTGVEQVIPLFDQSRALLDEFKRYAQSRKVRPLTVVTSRGGRQMTAEGFATAVHRAHKAAGVAAGKTLHDLRGTFATRLMDMEFKDEEIDEILGWDTGKSKRIRRVYISRRNVVLSAIKRMREKTGKGET